MEGTNQAREKKLGRWRVRNGSKTGKRSNSLIRRLTVYSITVVRVFSKTFGFWNERNARLGKCLGSGVGWGKIFVATYIKSRTRAKEAHTAGAYPGFRSMKQPRVLLLPPGRDASPSQGYLPAVCRRYPFIHPGGERQCGAKYLV